MFGDPTGSSWALTGLSHNDAQGPRQHDLTCPVNETLSPAFPSCIKASYFSFDLFVLFFGGFRAILYIVCMEFDSWFWARLGAEAPACVVIF